MNEARDNHELKFAGNLSSLKESKEDILHIISAGPSVRKFDWRILRGKDIMTINDSIFYLPLKVTYLVYNEPYEKEQERYYKMTKKYPLIHKFTTFNVKHWHQLNLYSGKNLAFMLAINLAIDLGYKEVRLYGYDFECIDGYIHWWDKTPEKDKNKIKEKMELVYKQKDLFEEFKKEISNKIILKEIKGFNG